MAALKFCTWHFYLRLCLAIVFAMAERIEIWTDGACSGNPGPGGWGAVLTYRAHHKELSGYQAETTNNQMELTGAIAALKELKKPSKVTLYTDSIYVKDGLTKWIKGWKRNGWKTAQKKPVKNKALWQELDQQAERHDIDWQWIKGHSGNIGNERADQLARLAIENAKLNTRETASEEAL